MRPKILSVGVDPGLLFTRQALLASRGYDCAIALPVDIDDALTQAPFDLAILSVMLSDADTQLVEKKLPADIKVLKLTWMVQPDELLGMVAVALGQ